MVQFIADHRAVFGVECPSSDDLRQGGASSNGGSGSPG